MSDVTYTWRESFDMCSNGVCKYWAHDMDSSYCAHPESYKASPIFGLSLNAMIKTGLCTGCNDDPKKNLRQLFEPIKIVNI